MFKYRGFYVKKRFIAGVSLLFFCLNGMERSQFFGIDGVREDRRFDACVRDGVLSPTSPSADSPLVVGIRNADGTFSPTRLVDPGHIAVCVHGLTQAERFADAAEAISRSSSDDLLREYQIEGVGPTTLLAFVKRKKNLHETYGWKMVLEALQDKIDPIKN